MELDNREYYLSKQDNLYVPVSCLDNILLSNNFQDFKLDFYNHLNGDKLDSKLSLDKFYEDVMNLTTSRKYFTTDHLIYSITIDDVSMIYVSLDNSVRSNMNNSSLAQRLENLLEIVCKILLDKPKSMIFFSESCRKSFQGNINNKTNEKSWLLMREIIQDKTNLKFLFEKKNNEDHEEMSFGISVWYTIDCSESIKSYFSEKILDVGFGSVATGIRLHTNKIIWCVHFPLDFRNKSNENHGAITMRNLIELMKKYPDSVCAFGDMNIIPGEIKNAIFNVLQENTFNFKLLLDNVPTFFGAYYDTVKIDNVSPEPIYIFDSTDEIKYGLLNYI